MSNTKCCCRSACLKIRWACVCKDLQRLQTEPVLEQTGTCAAMPLLPARYGQHTLVHGGAHLQTARWAPCCSWPSHLPENRCRLAAERQQASAKQTRHPVAWSRSTRRCKRVCSSVAEQAPSWGRAGGSSSRAGAGVRGLLQRLRKRLPSADALALQAGAIRHPKFAPMVFLCVPTSKSNFGAAYRYIVQLNKRTPK